MQINSRKIITCMTILITVVVIGGLLGCKTSERNEINKPGRIIVINETIPNNSPVDFHFALSYGVQVGHPDGLTLRDGDQIDSGFTLPPGNYAVTENVPQGWEMSSVVINDASGGSFSSGNLATIGLAAGETVTMKFTNTPTSFPSNTSPVKLGSIILIVQTSPDRAPDSFKFTLSYGAQIGCPNGKQLSCGQLLDSGFTLPPGNYVINEDIPTGWELGNIAISDASGGSSHSGNMAVISLAEGETVTVIYTNKVLKTGRIILMVQTNPDGASDDFGLTLSYGTQIGYPNSLHLQDGQLLDSAFKLPANQSYTINELIPQGWQLTKIDINVGNSGKPSVSSLTTVPAPLGNVATIALGEGETVVVTFYNNWLGMTPTTTPIPTPTPTPTTTPTPAPTTITVAGPRYGGTLALTRTTEISSWDPVQNLGDDVLDLIYQRLWQGDWTKGPAGGYGANVTSWLSDNSDWSLKTGTIAESCNWIIDQASGQGIIVYKIRRGIHWQLLANRSASQLVNGRELTADDVVFCLRRAITDNTAYIKLHYPELSTANINKTGDWEITVSIPSASLNAAISIFSGYVYVYPPELVTVFGNMQDWQTAVGTGPFILTQVITGSSAWLFKNPNFWMVDPIGPGKGNQLPYLDDVKVYVIPDLSTRLAALKAAKIDYLRGISAGDAASLMQKYPALCQILGVSSSSFWWSWVKNYSGEDTIGYSEHIWPQYIWYDTSLKANMGH